MPERIFSFYKWNFPIIIRKIIIINEIFIAGVVGRVDVDDVDFAGVCVG